MKKLITLLMLVVTALTSSAQVQLRGSDPIGWSGTTSECTFTDIGNNEFVLDWKGGNITDFKICIDNARWYGKDNTTVTIGQTITLDGNGNVQLGGTIKNNIRFKYNTHTNVLSLSEIPTDQPIQPVKTKIQMHGQILGDDKWASYEMTTEDGVNYKLDPKLLNPAKTSFVKGEFGFKIGANEDWHSAPQDNVNVTTTNTDYTFQSGGNNFKSTLIGDYILELNNSTKKIKFVPRSTDPNPGESGGGTGGTETETPNYTYRLFGNTFAGNDNAEVTTELTGADGKWSVENDAWKPNTTFVIQKMNGTEVVATLGCGENSVTVSNDNLSVTTVENSTNKFINNLDGKYKLEFDPSSTNNNLVFTFTGTVVTPDPDPVTPPATQEYDYYIKGEVFNDGWEPHNMVYDETNKTYSYTANWVAQGQFGIARFNKGEQTLNNDTQKGWYGDSNVTFKSETEPGTVTATTTTLANNNYNSTLSGNWTITFDPSNNSLTVKNNNTSGGGNPEQPTVPTVTPITLNDGEFIVIKGTMFGDNDWVNYRMKDNEDGTWSIKSRNLTPKTDFGLKVSHKNDVTSEVKWINALDAKARTIDSENLTVYAKDKNVDSDKGNFVNQLKGAYEITFNPTAMTLTFTSYVPSTTYSLCTFTTDPDKYTSEALTANGDGTYSMTKKFAPCGFFISETYNDNDNVLKLLNKKTNIGGKVTTANGPFDFAVSGYEDELNSNEKYLGISHRGEFEIKYDPANHKLTVSNIGYLLTGDVEGSQKSTPLSFRNDYTYEYPKTVWHKGDFTIEKTVNGAATETYKPTTAISATESEQTVTMDVSGAATYSEVDGREVRGYWMPDAKSFLIFIADEKGNIGSGVEDLLGSEGEVEYYTLQGVKVSKENLSAGMYIVKKGGKTAKVMVK